MKRYFAIILFAAALASCTPKLYDAQVEVPENYRFAGDFPQDSVSLPFAWWEIFGDSTLNRLVEHALENNRNLAQAASRIFEARANIAVARAPFLPSVGLNLSAQGNYTEPTGTTQQYTIEPSISWEVPLFGTLRSANRAAKAALYSSEWGYRGVMLSLTAEVATSYFTVLQYTRDLRIARQSYVLRRESAALVDSLARYGMSNGVALQQAMSLVYQAEADIPQYQRAVEQSRLALCVLLGENPSYFGDETFDDALLDNYQVMDIPVGLPSELLERRPDIMEASFNMDEAAANVGLARSKRFPSITLTGAGGIVPVRSKVFPTVIRGRGRPSGRSCSRSLISASSSGRSRLPGSDIIRACSPMRRPCSKRWAMWKRACSTSLPTAARPRITPGCSGPISRSPR